MNQSLTDLRKKPERELTAEEKLAVFGKGNPARILYREVKQADGTKAVVSRSFGPDEKPSKEWKESPADFGVITAPNREQRVDDEYDSVVAVVAPKKAEG